MTARTHFLAVALICPALCVGVGAAPRPQSAPPAAAPGGAPSGAPGTPGAPDAPRAPGAPRTPRGGQEERAASVGGAMKGMGRALRGLREAVADPARRDEALAAINDMQRNCVVAKGLPLPAGVQRQVTDPEARAKLAAVYRADLMKLLRELLALEQSVLDGRADDARARVDAIIATRDAGHKALGIDD